MLSKYLWNGRRGGLIYACIGTGLGGGSASRSEVGGKDIVAKKLSLPFSGRLKICGFFPMLSHNPDSKSPPIALGPSSFSFIKYLGLFLTKLPLATGRDCRPSALLVAS